MITSTKVRIWEIGAPYKGKRKTSYYVRWTVEGQPFKETRGTKALANSFRAKLVTAAADGVPFDVESGLPVTLIRKETTSMSWFELACAYVDMKWPDAAPRHRQSIADALTPITEAMLTSSRGRPVQKVLRKALRVLFNSVERDAVHPCEIADALTWLSRNTRPISDLTKPDVLRAVVNEFERKLNGEKAAPDTIRLRRVTFGGALDFAVEKDALAENPLKQVKTAKRKTVFHEVDRRSVANPVQFRTVLNEVPECGRIGRRLKLFFQLLYFAGLRPEEATNLRRNDLALPERTWNDETHQWEVHEWGEIYLDSAAPEVGAEWTDSRTRNEERSLKHREVTEGRTVPLSPEVVLSAWEHIDEFGIGPDGLLFVGERGGRLASSTYCRVWAMARTRAFTPEVAATPLAKRPYDLRHACVSNWLNAGVEPPRVAKWAGHSLAVLMRVYAKCIDGGEELARRLVQASLGSPNFGVPLARTAV